MVAGGTDAVAAGGEDLDDLHPILDFLADGAAEAFRPIGDGDAAGGAHLPLGGIAEIVAMAGGADIAPAGHDARARDRALGDGGLHRRVDAIGRARADRAGKAAIEQQPVVLGRPQRLQRRRRIQPEGRGHQPEILITRVIVPHHHARHHRTPGQIDHAIIPGARLRAIQHRRDPLALDDHAGAAAGVCPIEDMGVVENQPGHSRSPGRLLPAPPVPSGAGAHAAFDADSIPNRRDGKPIDRAGVALMGR